MEWIELATAVGTGTIVAKIIDIKLLQPYLAKRRLADWVREKRFHAFSKLTKNLIAFGLEDPGTSNNPFEHYAIAADALLLIDDRNLCDKIDKFIAKRDAMYQESNGEKSTEMYDALNVESREIITALRNELRSH